VSLKCPKDGTDLVYALGYFEKAAPDNNPWNINLFMVNEFLCPKCQLRIKMRGAVLQLGGGKVNVIERK
jgi:hypothetical protein